MSFSRLVKLCRFAGGRKPAPVCAIVEPSPVLGRALSDLVSSFGLRVTAFDNAEDFRTACPALRPAIVIVDAEVFDAGLAPRGSGNLASGPAILVSAHADRPASILRGMAEGADDYIVKPFDAEVLQSKLHCLGVV